MGIDSHHLPFPSLLSEPLSLVSVALQCVGNLLKDIEGCEAEYKRLTTNRSPSAPELYDWRSRLITTLQVLVDGLRYPLTRLPSQAAGIQIDSPSGEERGIGRLKERGMGYGHDTRRDIAICPLSVSVCVACAGHTWRRKRGSSPPS
jgi:hypothetical protein